MKNIWKKATALIGVGLFVLTGGVMPRLALAEQRFVFYDDFEGEAVGAMPSQWQIAPGKKVTAETVAEGGNQFMRMTAQESGDSAKNRPTVQTKSGLVSARLQNETKKLVVEAKMRTQNSSMRKSLRLGYTDNDWDANQYNLIAFRNPAGNFTYLNGSIFDGNSTQTVMTQLDGFVNDASAWYEVRAVIDPTSGAIDYTLVKSGTEEIYKVTGKMDSPEYSALQVITDLNFRFVTAQVGESVDVDDIKLYYIYPAPTASLLADGGELPSNVQKIGIRFSENMDTQSLTAETVRLENTDGETILCTERSYDDELCTYYLTPDVPLHVGERYQVVLSENIYAANGAENREDGKLIGDRVFSFIVTAAKNTDASLSRLTVNGALVPNFNSDVFEYTVSMEYDENLSMPVVQAEPTDANAHAAVSYPPNVGETVKVTVTAEDGITQQVYLVHFNLIGEDYAKLGKNLLTNEGFEAGSLAGYNASSASWNGFLLTSDVVRSGQYAALCTNRSDATWHYMQKVTAEAKKTYLLSGWVRLRHSEDAGNSFEIYPAGSVTRPFRDEEKVAASAAEWRQVVLTAETASTVQISPSVQCWAANVDYYVDDLFVGELKPILNYTGAETIAVKGDSVQTVPLSAELVNQLGTKHGLKYSSVRGWKLLSAPYGVSLTKNNELQIEKDAEAGTILLEVSADLHYTGAFADTLTKQVAVTVTDSSDTAPKAKGVRVSGTVAEGASLKVTYRYYQSEGKPAGEPAIIWMASQNPETGYQPIPNATGEHYIVDAAYADWYIRAQVTPQTQDGETGQPTMSENYLCRAAAPQVQKAAIAVPTACGLGDVLTGSYVYFDLNDDAEDTEKTRMQWLRSKTKDGTYTPIPNATGASYTLTDEDVEHYLVFEVTPAAAAEPIWGEAVRSEAVCGPMLPYAENVSIEKISSKLLSASYRYGHPHQVAEGETQFRWYVGSKLVGTERSCTFSSLDGVTVRLEVTPAAVKAPQLGQTVATEASFSNRSQSYGGSSRGNGGGGGGSFSGYVPLPDTETETKPDDASEQPIHWAQSAMNWAKEVGYMQNGEEKTPDEQVSRQLFLTYVLRCVGLQPTSYANLFGDVSAADDFSGLLQTAVDRGIISKDELFYPQRSVTREEICKIVITALKASGCAVKSGDISGFTDAELMADWAKDYIQDMVGTGIMQGAGDGQFMPRGTVTVGQTAVILQRISNYCEQAKAVAAQ